MKLVELYKGVKIEQDPTSNLFCGTFPKGSWYGWCSNVDQVKSKVDKIESDCIKYGMTLSGDVQ